MVAKAIVDFALRAACRRMVLTVNCLQNQQCEGVSLGSARKSAPFLKTSSMDVSMDWRQPSINSEGYVSASSELVVNGSSTTIDEVKRKSVSFHIEEDSMPVDTLSDAYYSEQIRIVAKKLVNKALHVACHKLESLYRRSSIEYLIASTKRMRIDDSPPPPPTLFEAEEQNDNISEFLTPRARGPLERLSRKKRGRSGSHEVSQLKELRKTKLGKGFQFQSARHTMINSTGSESSRRILSVTRCQRSAPVESNLATMNSASSLGDAQRLSLLVSDVKRMSISTCSESESDTTLDSEETQTYTILSAVTVNTVQKEEESQTVGGDGMLYTDVSPRERDGLFQNTYLKDQNRGCTGTNERSLFPIENPSCVDSSILSQVRNSVAGLNVIPDMDLFFIIHTHPSPGLCQKFLCSNTNEVNLLYHCWMFPDVPFSPSLVISKKLEMGLFDPSGIQSVHLDLQDAGIPFGYLDERFVH